MDHVAQGSPTLSPNLMNFLSPLDPSSLTTQHHCLHLDPPRPKTSLALPAHSRSITMADPKFLKYVDDHQDDYIKLLAKAVSIPSYVSLPLSGHIASASAVTRQRSLSRS